MQSRKVTVDAQQLRSPGASVWRSVRGEAIELTGTPLGLQPTPYVIASWKQPQVGRVKRLEARSAHNGSEIAFYLEWKDASPETERKDTDVFPDGAGILFPLHEDAPLATMGDEAHPVTAWHWRADLPDRARINVARGLGTTVVTDRETVRVDAAWEAGRWRVVFSRPLRIDAGTEEAVQFAAGDTLKVAFAVWEGGNGERAGIKAFSPSWHSVVLDG
jgi:DMSO reductase family type II enzyme heme b subunit